MRLDPRVEDVLLAWVARRGLEPGPLFCPINKAGRLVLRAMTDQAVYLMVRKWAQQASIQTCSPEDLRRSFLAGLRPTGPERRTGLLGAGGGRRAASVGGIPAVEAG